MLKKCLLCIVSLTGGDQIIILFDHHCLRLIWTRNPWCGCDARRSSTMSILYFNAMVTSSECFTNIGRRCSKKKKNRVVIHNTCNLFNIIYLCTLRVFLLVTRFTAHTDDGPSQCVIRISGDTTNIHVCVHLCIKSVTNDDSGWKNYVSAHAYERHACLYVIWVYICMLKK